MGTDLLHWINTATLGAVIIMMLRNKYDKLYKNIHPDDQLRQRERKRDEREANVKTERKLLQLVFHVYGYFHVCTRVRNELLLLFHSLLSFSGEISLNLYVSKHFYICLTHC